VLFKQGASLLPVLGRCHANYQAMQWDAGAAHLYQDIVDMDQYLLDVVRENIQEWQTFVLKDSSMSTCMKGGLVDVCLQQHLASTGIGSKRQDFFAYEEMEAIWRSGLTIDEIKALNLEYPALIRYPTQMIAACLVFTGPSKINVVGINVSEPFCRCTDPTNMVGTGGLPCELSGYVWSSTSRNAVNVANMHSIIVRFDDTSLEEKG